MSQTLEYNFTFREKDKGWQVILSYKSIHGAWKQKSKQGFKTRKEAKIYAETLLDQIKEKAESEQAAKELPIELQGITLREFADIVFRDRHLEYNSLISYSNSLSRFGSQLLDMPVADIRYVDIRASMQNWRYAASTQQQSIVCLKMVLGQACTPYNLRIDNPARSLRISSKKKQKKLCALTMEELNTLLSSLSQKNIKVYTICAIAGLAGLRFGEILGLTRADIDLTKGTISVTKQFNRIGKKQYGMKSIKNGKNGYRTVPIPERLCQIITQYKKVAPLDISGRLFPSRISNSSIINVKIQRIFPHTTIHDLRHTYATLLLAHGENIKTVAALLGDDVATVLNTYVDYTDDMRKQATKSIEKIFA